MTHKKSRTNQKYQGYDSAGDPNPAPTGELGQLDLYASAAARNTAARCRLRALKVRQNFVGTLVTIRRISFEATHDNPPQPVGERCVYQLRILWFFLDPLVHHFQRGFAGEWDVAGHHFVENQTKRVKVGALIRGLAFHLLGGHVTWSAEECAGTSHARRAFFKGFCQAKVANKNLIVISDQKVLRL